MSASVTCLLGLIVWAFVLLTLVLTVRIMSVAKSGHGFFFLQDGSDLSPTAQRITRAERNNLEWMVIPAALILYGIATGQSSVTNGLAMIVLYARLAQSTLHMFSGATPVVFTRATLFSVQFVIWVIWTINFIAAA